MTYRPRALLLAALLVALVACPGDPEPRYEATVRARNATEAPMLPLFADTLPEADPESFHRLLEQLQGTPVVVNIWGSWCPPCEDEMPRIVEAHEAFGRRVQFVGINFWETRAEARTFMRRFEMTFPSVFDATGTIKASLGFFGQPVTIFYERDGSFFESWAGPISEERLRENLRAIAG
jgi:cytochrome c biogenesis protein CcmG/thiol:disulfide interchange protein DsbE